MSASHCDPPPAASAARGEGPGGGAPSRDVVLALVGRPNVGKSSVFNRLTGGDAHVGNYAGATVDVLEGEAALPSGARAAIVDLPGTYSLDADADRDTDEGVTRAWLDRAASRDAAAPLLVVQVLDATQLALSLRLTRELVRRGHALLVVANQIDVLEREGRALDDAALSRALGAPVVAVSARDPASRAAILEAASRRLADAPRAAPAPAWEPDALAREVVREARDGAAERRRRARTARADAVLLHPVAGPVLFVALMAALFAAVFLVADPVTAAMDAAVQRSGAWVTRALGAGLAASFVADGLLGGAGTVLAFLPQIVILTIAMELLEATGYLARGAFLVDRLLRVFGLGGRAFVPLLTAHACAVPAVAATRVLRDPRERLTAILVLPLMTCSARIPTYSLLITTFFAARSAAFKSGLFVGLYFAGIASGLLAALALRRTATRGRALPLVMEMPAYRTPEARAVARVAGRAASRFVRDVGTTIMVMAAVLWVLLTVPLPGATAVLWVLLTVPLPGATAGPAAPPGASERVVRMHRSIAAGVGRALEPVTAPAGFDWRINVGLVGSFGARELMVGTLGVIFGIEDAGDDARGLSERVRAARRPDGRPAYSSRTALALMAFFVLACQCMSTVAAIRRETRGWRWPLFVLGYTYVLAYVAAVAVYHGAGLLGVG